MKAVNCLLLLMLFAACGKKHVATDPDIYYTCSMHPQVVESHPGLCPICHMDLIAVKRSQHEKAGVIELSEEQIKLGGITTDTVGLGNIASSQTLNGILAALPTSVISISSRLAGRVETLYAKAPGDAVVKGQPIYRLYSEELYNTQRDYLTALHRKDSLNGFIDFKALANSAKNKLLLWGMTERQIQTLTVPGFTTDVFSPASGVVTDVYKREGEYLMDGEALMQVADYTTLWVETQLYTHGVGLFKEGQRVDIRLPDGRSVNSKIEFLSPETTPGTQLVSARAAVANPQLIYRPGMPVSMTFATQATADAVVIPKSAVLYDAMGTSIWIKTGDHQFEVRSITVGNESNGLVEVKSGLKRGEEIVVSGVYLLNSEYVFRNGTSSMDPNMDM